MTEIPDFMLRAGLGALVLALAAGPVGCLIVWRRMAFFGDTLAHATLLGLALSLALQLPIAFGVLVSSLMIALLLAILSRRHLASDTLLGVLSPTALALGLIALSQMPSVRIDLTGWLFGDILAITWMQLYLMAGGAAVVLLALFMLWKPLLAIITAPDLAAVSGARVAQLEALLLVLMAMVIVLGIQLAGVLLISALLLIPAATARRFAHTPEQMVGLAVLVGLTAGLLGLVMSYYADVPAGPAIVTAAAVLFAASQITVRR